MKPPRITLYSAPGCPHCKAARHFLQQRGLRFQEFDVQRNARGRKEFERMGGSGVPLIMIGTRRVDGFHAERLAKALERAGCA